MSKKDRSGKKGAGASEKASVSSREGAIKPVAENRKARHKFQVIDSLECGMVLLGSEVKSLRAGNVSLDEAYAKLRNGELWLLGCHIAEYPEAGPFNHVPTRPRKLLLHRRELQRFATRAEEKGFTLVPLKIYFRRGFAKVLLGLCRGLKTHDKREAMKRRETEKQIRSAMYRR